MTTLAIASLERRKYPAVAPWTHTLMLAAAFVLVAGGGALVQHHAQSDPGTLQQHHQLAPLYVGLIVMEWALLLFVRKGLHAGGHGVRELIGGRWDNAPAVMLDVALGLGLWVVWTALQLGWDRWLGASHAASIQSLLPRSFLDISLWCGVCISAGFCEELVFRGYFQRQLQAFTQSKWLAVLLQSLLFGIAHGYQGVDACARIALYAVLFSALAMWRRSLRPGMLAHTWTDLMAGIFAI